MKAEDIEQIKIELENHLVDVALDECGCLHWTDELGGWNNIKCEGHKIMNGEDLIFNYRIRKKEQNKINRPANDGN